MSHSPQSTRPILSLPIKEVDPETSTYEAFQTLIKKPVPPSSASKYKAHHDYDLAIVIGRFQPMHVGHQILFQKAMAISSNVLTLIGSSASPRTIKNPFTFQERAEFVRGSLSEYKTNLHVAPLPDSLYSDMDWAKSVQMSVDAVLATLPEGPKNVALIGHKKDESSYYLDMFPQYTFVNVDEVHLELDATMLRTLMFEKPAHLYLIESLVPKNVHEFLVPFVKTDTYTRLYKEYQMIQKYKDAWKAAPYAPTFITADAVVKKNGHILLVKRKEAPGQGLLALPGGFVNQNEFIRDAAIRELREETQIDLPPNLLRNSIKGEGKLFDAPGRSLRGRTVTTAFLFDLDEADVKLGLPKVKGADDAAEALWVPISEIFKKQELMFEDHPAIIHRVLGL